MYSTRNEGQSVISVRFITILKNKRSKYMTTIKNGVYIDKLNDIINEYDNHVIEQSKGTLLILRQVHRLTLTLKIMMSLIAQEY